MRFFFDFDDGGARIVDEDGVECADVDNATSEAVIFLAEIVRDYHPERLVDRDWSSIIRDESGRPVRRARLSISVESLAGDGLTTAA